MINREKLVGCHNPTLKSINEESPLTVGNGDLCFTADITGLQSLYADYNKLPLCTMSQWGWHSIPVSKEQKEYTLKDLEMTEYDYADRKVHYAVEEKEGNEEVYNWLRKNPHRLNLAKIGLQYKKERLKQEQITEISQELNLYEGILYSAYKIEEKDCKVITSCSTETDKLGFEIESEMLKEELQIEIAFPYGTHKISGADWKSGNRHVTKVVRQNENSLVLERKLDNDIYYVILEGNNHYDVSEIEQHKIVVKTNDTKMSLQAEFVKELPSIDEAKKTKKTIEEERTNTKIWWKNFWEKGGIVSLQKAKDKRASELERRIILSQYLLAIQSAGSLPPAETGLTCNSWYGKFHLEMHLWHSAWLPLWNQDDLLLRSTTWYKKHLKEAKANAKRNGYVGAKWPKMIAEEGIDAPSQIATLLIWQQPHIMYMLELLFQNIQSKDFLEEYWEIMSESAEYMADLAHYDKQDSKYHLIAPIIPAQEEHDPRITKNPTFELEYWKLGLEIAVKWAERLGKNETENVETWKKVAENLAEPSLKNGLYLAHENCPETFEKFNRDHPSMLGAYGLLYSDRMNPEAIRATIQKVLECWEFDTMWGWDFALMAMSAVRIGDYELAVELLLKDTAKNQYVVSGNNYQYLRTDLPLYLPGNGSLLLVVAMMTAGYKGKEENGFPKDGNWNVEYENIAPFPY